VAQSHLGTPTSRHAKERLYRLSLRAGEAALDFQKGQEESKRRAKETKKQTVHKSI